MLNRMTKFLMDTKNIKRVKHRKKSGNTVKPVLSDTLKKCRISRETDFKILKFKDLLPIFIFRRY